MKIKKGFTLAEVLVVLFILGVIGSLMMVSLNKSRPDEDALMYKKAFFSLQEAASNLVNDMSLYPEGDLLKRDSASGDTGNLCGDLMKQFATIGTACTTSTNGAYEFTTANNITYSIPTDNSNGWEITVKLPSATEAKINLSPTGKVFTTGSDTSFEVKSLKKTKVTK